jgi:hypothetical protein
MRWPSLIVAVFLVGCSTTIQEMREHHPIRATYISERNPTALAQCLADRLSGSGSPSIIPGESYTLIAFTVQNDTGLLLTLSPLPDGRTRVEVRQRVLFSPRNARHVETCVNQAN